MKLEEINKNHLCLGCGICESLLGKKSGEMKLGKDGFFYPEFNSVNKQDENVILKACPGININNNNKFGFKDSVWGKISDLFVGYSTDNEVRNRGSSGGVISALAIYLLENRLVDGILQVGPDDNDFRSNKLKISRNRSDVLACASSRYAPALIFNDIFEILNKDEKYCFIGKPCDIAALNNILKEFPHCSEKIIYKISFFCAGMPSFKGTEEAINKLSINKKAVKLKYRGNGWPGYFSFEDTNGSLYQLTYKESWGKILGKHIHYRCKICPDGIGLQADIVMGDAWETVDGYPDFSEKKGESIIITRNNQGSTLVQSLIDSGYLETKKIGSDKLEKIQPSQYERRKIVLARLIALFIKKRIFLRFNNMKLLYNLLSIKPSKIYNQFLGTMKRTR